MVQAVECYQVQFIYKGNVPTYLHYAVTAGKRTLKSGATIVQAHSTYKFQVCVNADSKDILHASAQWTNDTKLSIKFKDLGVHK